jgi:hypothetical protein
LKTEKEIQRVNKRGLVFGITWIMGIGSVIAIISAVQSYRLLYHISGNNSNRKYRKEIIRNCVIGIIGLSVWIPIAILIIKK